MDFIALASLSNVHRHLHASNGDDDMLIADSVDSGHPASTLLNDFDLPEESARPLLSPSAESELLLLATNFLLYVAMIIITTIVAKIYFPDSLERGNFYERARNIDYVRVESNASYYSDYSDNNEDDEEKDDIGLDPKFETEDNPEECVSVKKGKRSKKSKKPKRRKSSNSFLEFEQSSIPRHEVLKRLAFCCVMLNLTFVTWGALQERMLTRRYPRITGEYFTYSYALVFSNRLWTLIMSGVMMLYLKPHRSKSTVIYEYSFPSISNMLSSWCQYEALRYISFPATTLFKSFKLVPVMVMGKFLGNKEYPQYDYFVALVIGAGIALFMSSTDDLQFGYDIYSNEAETWTGIMLLGFFLFFDSFTGQWQSRMFQRHRDLSMIELLFATSAFSTILSFITLIHEKELGPAINFVVRHSEIHVHIFVFSVCSTIGQITIFYTIKNFGAVVFTLIMTMRVLLSIALSCVLYKHKVTPVGFLGLTLVVVAVLYRIKRKAEGTQLIKWKGLDDAKASELVQEWHEHLDT